VIYKISGHVKRQDFVKFRVVCSTAKRCGVNGGVCAGEYVLGGCRIQYQKW
jgi:hypothetical protein